MKHKNSDNVNVKYLMEESENADISIKKIINILQKWDKKENQTQNIKENICQSRIQKRV